MINHEKDNTYAVLQVLDDQKQVVDEWTTDGTVHEIIGVLKAGRTYPLHEKTVPLGYEKICRSDFSGTGYGRTIECYILQCKAEG